MRENEKLIKIIICIFLLLIVFDSEAKGLSPSTPSAYVQALQAADSFLWAWVNRDADTGRLLISRKLSSKLQKENSEEWFRDYMVGLSNPHHHSFEIGPGKAINSKRTSFSVILYEYYTGEREAFKYKGHIELVLDGDSWKVDVLPATSDNQ
jgi:hypothetical protein